ncbi:MAG: O-methyltransferase [Bdellovibrionales bacterium CG10_big_fil_rev_8_21_14_0_10_45_34]|nr:MAG: O-methyltransferase [Bdellovibrionales bacterium CG10_big_fil_rev_8_21_14_0_10_45_34]
MKRFGIQMDHLEEYVQNVFQPEDDDLLKAREFSDDAGLPQIQVGPMDGRHLSVLAASCGARKMVEIGTLGGYSGVCLLKGAAMGAHLWTLEIDQKHFEVAQKTFKNAGFEKNVTPILGSALEKLKTIENEGPFDLVFVDADKVSYPHYLEWASRNLRVGGMLIGDNTFAFGKLADPYHRQESVLALREFNKRVAQSGRYLGTILPTSEGLTVGVKIR